MKSKVLIGSINADLIEYAHRPSQDGGHQGE
jgi:hypothetical protein